MTKQNRDTLKRLFRRGAMPGEEAFADLIESTLNIVDQHFDKTPADGLKVGQIRDGRLMSFYHDITQKSAIWSVKMEQVGNSLVFGTESTRSGSYRKAMELGHAPEGVGFAPLTGQASDRDTPFQLDLQGRVVADGRIGRAVATVPADGQWHDLTEQLTGCQAFEVMAGTGREGSGKYAVMHAYALNTFQTGRGEIVYHQAHHGSKCSRLELRWTRETKKSGDPYRLQIRTRCPLDGPAVVNSQRTGIRVYLTQLWFDPAMRECVLRGAPL